MIWHKYTARTRGGMTLAFYIRGADHASQMSGIARDEPMWRQAIYLGGQAIDWLADTKWGTHCGREA